MYSYQYVFYKPDQRQYTQRDAVVIGDKLTRVGFGLQEDNNTNGRLGRLHFDVYSPEATFSLHLGPAEERFNGEIGRVSVPEGQLRADPEKVTGLFNKLAIGVFCSTRPIFAWGDHELELRKLEPFLRLDRVNALAWTNFFSQEMIDSSEGIGTVLLRLSGLKDLKGESLYLTKLGFHPILLSTTPNEPFKVDRVFDFEQISPGIVYRSFEIPSLKGIERT